MLEDGRTGERPVLHVGLKQQRRVQSGLQKHRKPAGRGVHLAQCHAEQPPELPRLQEGFPVAARYGTRRSLPPGDPSALQDQLQQVRCVRGHGVHPVLLAQAGAGSHQQPHRFPGRDVHVNPRSVASGGGHGGPLTNLHASVDKAKESGDRTPRSSEQSWASAL